MVITGAGAQQRGRRHQHRDHRARRRDRALRRSVDGARAGPPPSGACLRSSCSGPTWTPGSPPGLLILARGAAAASGPRRRAYRSRRQLAHRARASARSRCSRTLSGPASTRRCSPGVFNPGVAQSLAGWASPNFHDWSARLFEARDHPRHRALDGLGRTRPLQRDHRLRAAHRDALRAGEPRASSRSSWRRSSRCTAREPGALHVAPRIAGPSAGRRARHLHPIATSAVLLAMTAAMAVVLVPQLSAVGGGLVPGEHVSRGCGGYVGATLPRAAHLHHRHVGRVPRLPIPRPAASSSSTTSRRSSATSALSST